VVLIRAIVAVIHAVLQAAVSSLLAGFSVLILLVIALAVVGAIGATLAGGLGFTGLRWVRRRSRAERDRTHEESSTKK
jgi:hypothetical protein